LRRSRGTRAVHHARASNGRIAGRNAATDGVGDGSATAELANAGCSSEFRRSEHDDSEHASTGNNFAERDAGSGRQRTAACANAAFDDAWRIWSARSTRSGRTDAATERAAESRHDRRSFGWSNRAPAEHAIVFANRDA